MLVYKKLDSGNSKLLVILLLVFFALITIIVLGSSRKGPAAAPFASRKKSFVHVSSDSNTNLVVEKRNNEVKAPQENKRDKLLEMLEEQKKEIQRLKERLDAEPDEPIVVKKPEVKAKSEIKLKPEVKAKPEKKAKPEVKVEPDIEVEVEPDVDVETEEVVKKTTKLVTTKKKVVEVKQVKANKIKVKTDVTRQNAVREAIKHAFNGYASRCWGQDDVNADSGTCENWLNQGNTIVDSMDTLWIAGLKEEFARGREWIASNLRFDTGRSVSFFETTIRVLGGLLSTYELSGKDKIFLDKAEDLGSRLIAAFSTPSGLPRSQIDLATRFSQNFGWTGGSTILAEVGTVQLEFAVLSRYTGKNEYKDKSRRVFEILDRMNKPMEGLYPIFLSTDQSTPQFTNNVITLGAMGDSLYEYMLKLFLLNGDKLALKMYKESARGIRKHLYQTPNPAKQPRAGFASLADHQGGINKKMDHLACFAAGMFALGVHRKVVEGEEAKQHLEMAEALTESCVQMYKQFASGLAPEFVNFGPEGEVQMGSAPHNLLRPETVESLMILYRVTGKEKYREEGWKIFQNFEKHCKAEFGYSGLQNVDSTNPAHHGKQESFFIAETLKYLYLLFSDDETIPLDKYVFNTEAHPLEIFS